MVYEKRAASRHQPLVTPVRLFSTLAICALAICGAARAAPLSPFNLVVVDIFSTGDVTVSRDVVSSASAPVFVEGGTAPNAYGKARADFGSNGFATQGLGNGLGAGAGSMWSDGFTITGGVGTGTLRLSVQIDGSITGNTDFSYALFASTSPFDAQDIFNAYETGPGRNWNPQVPGALRLLYTAVENPCPGSAGCGQVPTENFQGSLNLVLAGNFVFTYGVTYYLASVLDGDTADEIGGSGDFFNSANFGISVPVGATLRTTSNAQYAAAVPEPTSFALFVAALLGLAIWARKTGSPSRLRNTAS